jgi:hypothetical protein
MLMKMVCLSFVIIIVASAMCGSAGAIELTQDNPRTIISTKSKDYTIQGLRLGITHNEAWGLLAKISSLIGFHDPLNPARIYVYDRRPDGRKGEAVLYLIWEPGEETMSQITVFQGFRGSLSQNFRRLLTFEAVDDQSPFKKEFIGYANRSKITLDLPEIGLKHVTYFYDDIGLEITYKRSSQGDEVVFALVRSKPERSVRKVGVRLA